jgi:hypothetical protein
MGEQLHPRGRIQSESLEGIVSPDVQRSISLEPEVRRAHLFTEFTIDGNRIAVEALGARGCQVDTVSVRDQQGTVVYGLRCSLTYFAADDTPVGPVRIVQDPRIDEPGYIYLRRSERGDFVFPALSYFNQHRAWQVVSSITQWPPEYHQYHHLEPDTPVFDLLSGEPNVARKGVSTVSIQGPLDPEEEKAIWADFRREQELILSLPGTIMAPQPLTPAQGDSTSSAA